MLVACNGGTPSSFPSYLMGWHGGTAQCGESLVCLGDSTIGSEALLLRSHLSSVRGLRPQMLSLGYHSAAGLLWAAAPCTWRLHGLTLVKERAISGPLVCVLPSIAPGPHAPTIPSAANVLCMCGVQQQCQETQAVVCLASKLSARGAVSLYNVDAKISLSKMTEAYNTIKKNSVECARQGGNHGESEGLCLQASWEM